MAVSVDCQNVVVDCSDPESFSHSCCTESNSIGQFFGGSGGSFLSDSFNGVASSFPGGIAGFGATALLSIGVASALRSIFRG